MKILHVVAGLWEHTGGPAEVIPKLCESLMRENCEVTLASIDGPHSESILDCEKNGVEVLSFSVHNPSPIRYSSDLATYIKNNIEFFDVVHNHGHWLYPNWVAFKYAKKTGTPLVTTPHGTLVPGMLARSRLKKWLSWQLVDKYLIDYASVIHALSSAEKNEMVPKVGKVNCKKIITIPNGVDIWSLKKPINLYRRFPQLDQKKIILFLSRVHPIKGIMDLLETWKLICDQNTDWHLLVVGPIEKEIEFHLNKLLQEPQLKKSTTLAGPIYGSARKEVFALADVFILPSYGEGLPTVLLEALSCQLPVICTNECNFIEAESAGAAFSGSAGKDVLLSNLLKMLKLSDGDRKNMGKIGLELIKKKYLWKTVAQSWIKTYTKLLTNNQKLQNSV